MVVQIVHSRMIINKLHRAQVRAKLPYTDTEELSEKRQIWMSRLSTSNKNKPIMASSGQNYPTQTQDSSVRAGDRHGYLEYADPDLDPVENLNADPDTDSDPCS